MRNLTVAQSYAARLAAAEITAPRVVHRAPRAWVVQVGNQFIVKKFSASGFQILNHATCDNQAAAERLAGEL